MRRGQYASFHTNAGDGSQANVADYFCVSEAKVSIALRSLRDVLVFQWRHLLRLAYNVPSGAHAALLSDAVREKCGVPGIFGFADCTFYEIATPENV